MWALRNIGRIFSKSLAHLQRSDFRTYRAATGMQFYSFPTPAPNPCTTFTSVIASSFRFMSTTKGRNMRSKVERRMRREAGQTQKEVRRAQKIRRKLMTEDERLIYNLRRAKKKVALLLQSLKKYELPELPAPRHDPELLTAEQIQAYKKIGFKNKNYVPVGVRGVFGGVVQNMHLHWKFHETVQVCCDNFPKEKIREMATMLARLSGGIVINIHDVKTIIMFRGRNYRQPKNLIPINTLTKRKALFKARFEQALESQKLNIKKIEQQLRRKGINPEDPVAMASIQRVAATFFRAIDEQQGTPYVFHADKKPSEIGEAKEEPLDCRVDDSDQEELDRYISEIERSTGLEWEAVEAAEKEESTRLRYWGEDNMGTRHTPSWIHDSDDEDPKRSWRDGSRRSDARRGDEESGDEFPRRGHGKGNPDRGRERNVNRASRSDAGYKLTEGEEDLEELEVDDDDPEGLEVDVFADYRSGSGSDDDWNAIGAKKGEGGADKNDSSDRNSAFRANKGKGTNWH